MTHHKGESNGIVCINFQALDLIVTGPASDRDWRRGRHPRWYLLDKS